jgi:hypothetical protein
VRLAESGSTHAAAIDTAVPILPNARSVSRPPMSVNE